MTPFAEAMAQTVLFVCQDGETTALRFWPGPLPDAFAISLARLTGFIGAADACTTGTTDTVAAASASAVQLTSTLILIPAPPSGQNYRYLLRLAPCMAAPHCALPGGGPAAGRQYRLGYRRPPARRAGAGPGESRAPGGAAR